MTADRLAALNQAKQAVYLAERDLKHFTTSPLDIGVLISESCHAEVVALITRDLEATLARVSQEFADL